MAKQNDHHTITLQYHKRQELKNGRLLEEDISFSYDIHSEIASKDDLDALELTQDIVQAIHESKTQLNNALNYEYKHDVLAYEEGISELAILADKEEVFNAAANHIRYEELHKALEQLSECQRRRLYLYYSLGYSYQEIARMEGVSWQSIRESVRRAKRRIMNIV